MVVIWRRPGTTARDQWTHGSVNLGTIHGSMHLTMSGKNSFSRYNFVYLLSFIAVVIPRTTGYVALDDVKILNGACPSARVCDFEDPAICGYQNDITAKFGWSRHTGTTSSSATGATNGWY